MRTNRHSPILFQSAFATGLLLFLLLTTSSAFAQFTNHSVGFEAGYIHVVEPLKQNIGGGPDFGILYTVYIDNGFDLYARCLVGIHRQQKPLKNVVGIFPAVGVRYLMSEEVFRPYVGASLSYMAFIMDEYSTRLSLSPFVGVEYFADEDFAIGFQAEYLPIISLNDPVAHSLAGVAKVSWGWSL